MNWSEVNWQTLEDLREGFLTGNQKDYWTDQETLANYDLTFGQRISWKWRAVLEELAQQKNWSHPVGASLYDWGCGTGVAAHTYLSYWNVPVVRLEDRSPLAKEFAENKVKESFPSVSFKPIDRAFVLLLSHVVNELSDATLSNLFSLCERAEAVIWVEPGTQEHSEKLIKARRALADKLHIMGPCTHTNTCGAENNSKFWCHNFAKPPANVFHDRNWSNFSHRLGIDLRSLPVSYLALSKSPISNAKAWGRSLGRPRRLKGETRFSVCSAEGISEERVLKRHPSWKSLKQERFARFLDFDKNIM